MPRHMLHGYDVILRESRVVQLHVGGWGRGLVPGKGGGVGLNEAKGLKVVQDLKLEGYFHRVMFVA